MVLLSDRSKLFTKSLTASPKLKQVFVVPKDGKLIVTLRILVTILYKTIPKQQVLNHRTRQVTETGVLWRDQNESYKPTNRSLSIEIKCLIKYESTQLL